MSVVSEPCPECGSRDNLKRWEDGHAYCYTPSCGYREGISNNRRSMSTSASNSLVHGQYETLRKRKISEATCKFFNYQVGEYKGKKCHIANFQKDGKVLAQKIRLPKKEFFCLGDTKNMGLFGQHLWSGGRKIVVTEGELDALSVAEAQSCKWPVVSIPNGAEGAHKVLGKELEWLENNFEEVILMFDGDAPGQKAAKQCALLFSPQKCKIASLGEFKDANEALIAGKPDVITSAVWNASVFRPDGIIAGSDTWELVNTPMVASEVRYPWKGLNEKLLGLRTGELVTFCAGTGAGKSTGTKEIASSLLLRGESVGYIALEESVRQAAIDFMSIRADKMLHLEKDLDETYLRGIWEEVFGDDRLYLYDHWGSMDSVVLSNRIRYMARGCGVKWFVVDHISIMVSGIEDGNERRIIDNLMTNLRSLAEELDVGIIIISHLKKPHEGKGFEDGKQISINDLRGSGAIGQLSDAVVAFERDQQKPDSLTTVRVLKARLKGTETGIAGYLKYDKTTGRLHETNNIFEEDINGTSGEEEGSLNY